MLTLTFASAVSVGLVLARIIWSGNLRLGFLVWNLFLAWLPLIFALLACEKYRTGCGRNWRFFGLTGAWLLFFPNAPYIFTDLIHLTTRFNAHFWVDLVLILSCAADRAGVWIRFVVPDAIGRHEDAGARCQLGFHRGGLGFEQFRHLPGTLSALQQLGRCVPTGEDLPRPGQLGG